MYVKGVKSAYRAPQYRAMVLMSEVLKVHTSLLITFLIFKTFFGLKLVEY